MFGSVSYDDSAREWRCRIDRHTVVVAASKSELEQSLDMIALSRGLHYWGRARRPFRLAWVATLARRIWRAVCFK